jgi:hypothetical protein
MSAVKERRAVKVTLIGCTLVLAECTPSELVDAYKGSAGDTVSANLDVLARSVREFNGQPMTYLSALTMLREQFPRTRQQAALIRTLDSLHAFDEATVQAVVDSREPCEGKGGYSEVVTLPDGRKVRLLELELRKVGAMLKAAQKTSKLSEEAQSLSAMMDCLRKSVCEVNGEALRPEALEGQRWSEHFTTRETMALYAAWGAMHTDEEIEVEMGE